MEQSARASDHSSETLFIYIEIEIIFTAARTSPSFPYFSDQHRNKKK